MMLQSKEFRLASMTFAKKPTETYARDHPKISSSDFYASCERENNVSNDAFCDCYL